MKQQRCEEEKLSYHDNAEMGGMNAKQAMKKFLNCYFDFVTQEKKVSNNKIIVDECLLAERFFILMEFVFMKLFVLFSCNIIKP